MLIHDGGAVVVVRWAVVVTKNLGVPGVLYEGSPPLSLALSS